MGSAGRRLACNGSTPTRCGRRIARHGSDRFPRTDGRGNAWTNVVLSGSAAICRPLSPGEAPCARCAFRSPTGGAWGHGTSRPTVQRLGSSRGADSLRRPADSGARTVRHNGDDASRRDQPARIGAFRSGSDPGSHRPCERRSPGASPACPGAGYVTGGRVQRPASERRRPSRCHLL
jgi:hypothetical protein